MPYLGETLPLSFQLLDSDASKFCRAIVTDPDGNPIAGSPVSLTNQGLGRYSSDALTMPNFDFVEVLYEPYDDAGFTIADEDHLVGTDVFRLEVPDTVIVAKLDQILQKLAGIALPGAAFNATIVQERVNEVIKDVYETRSLVQREDVVSTLQAQELEHRLKQNQIVSVIDEC